MATRWNFMADSAQLYNLGGILSSWRYAPISPTKDVQTEDGNGVSCRDSIRERLSSRAFRRALLAVLIFSGLMMVYVLLHTHGQSYLNPSSKIDSWQHSDEFATLSKYVDWSQYAYCQYVTTTAYLCNSVMIFEALHRLGSKASRVMLYPMDWTVDSESIEGRMLMKARDEYSVALQPIKVQHFDGDDTWADSFTKLLAFNQTQYKRVLSLDSDATILKPMDELFLMPSAPVGMPRAYWLDQPFLSSQLVLVEPSELEMQRVIDAFQHRKPEDYDMEIVNNLYGDNCLIIPHRRYDLLTGEFRADEHYKYLGSKEEDWDPDRIYDEAKFLHFSDWPLPKPWIVADPNEKDDMAPKCHQRDDGTEDCRDRMKWFFFYDDFRQRRGRICGSEYMGRGDSRARRDVERPWFVPRI